MGRPSKIKTHGPLVIEAIKNGHTNERAAALAGISEATIYEWISRGEKEGKGAFFHFSEDIKAAQANFISAHLANIQKHAIGIPCEKRVVKTTEVNGITTELVETVTTYVETYWSASAWLLERRFPELFGRNRLEISGPDGGPIEIEGEGLAAIRRARERR